MSSPSARELEVHRAASVRETTEAEQGRVKLRGDGRNLNFKERFLVKGRESRQQI